MKLRPLLLLLPLVFAAGAAAQSAGSSTPGPALRETNFRGRPISIDLRDASLDHFFKLIGELSGQNVVVHPDVQGKVTLNLKNVPWDQVLEIVLRMNNLYQIREGNVMLIVPAGRVAEMYR